MPSAPKKGRWCPICLSSGILFQKSSSLKVHMVKKHPGTKEQFEICSELGNREFGFEAEEMNEEKQKHTLPAKIIDFKIIDFDVSARPEGYAEEIEDPPELEMEMAEVKVDVGLLRRSSRKRMKSTRLTESILPDIEENESSTPPKLKVIDPVKSEIVSTKTTISVREVKKTKK